MKKSNEISFLDHKYRGIFYTPNHIAKYIVNNTIGILIKALLNELNTSKDETQLNIVFNKAKNLKFLDPACGDGVFLLEILKIMRDFYQFYNNRIDFLLKQNPACQIGEDFKKIEFPGLFALLNNIYGVDEDEAAIKETCIKLVNELEKEMKIEDSFLMDINIKIGNSLIFTFNYKNIKIFEQQLNKIIKLRTDLQNFTISFKTHQFIKDQIKEIQGPLDKELNSHLNKYFNSKDLKFKPLNWGLEFPEIFLFNKGFDIIVGNPPYIRVHKQESELKQYLRDYYISPKLDFDIYVCFFELSLNILKNNGLLSFIVPDKFLVREYGENLRYLILNNANIIELLDISRCNVFKVSTYPIIITLKKVEDPIISSKGITRFHQNSVNIYQIRGDIKDNLDQIKEFPNTFHKKINQIEFANSPKSRMYINIDQIYDIIKNKLEKLPKIRNFIENQNIFCGTPRAKDYHSWANYVTDKIPISGEFLKYLVCRNLSPFNIQWGIPINSFGKKYHSPYFKFLQGSMPEQKWRKFQTVPKVLIRGNDTRLTAVLDEEGYVFSGIYSIIQNQYPPNYLVGLLNSNLLNAYFFHKNPSIKVSGDFFSINSLQILQLPICPASPEEIYPIIKIVFDLEEVKKHKFDLLKEEQVKCNLQINDLLKQLNEKIYQLYNLDLKEINMIESFLKDSGFFKKKL